MRRSDLACVLTVLSLASPLSAYDVNHSTLVQLGVWPACTEASVWRINRRASHMPSWRKIVRNDQTKELSTSVRCHSQCGGACCASAVSILVAHDRFVALAADQLLCARPFAQLKTAALSAKFTEVDGGSYPGVMKQLQMGDGIDLPAIDCCARCVAHNAGLPPPQLYSGNLGMLNTPPSALPSSMYTPHQDTTRHQGFAAVLGITDKFNDSATAFYRKPLVSSDDVNMQALLSSSEPFPSSGPPQPSAAACHRANRLILYPATTHHQAWIPEPARLSADPQDGRLNVNVFFTARDAVVESWAGVIRQKEHVVNREESAWDYYDKNLRNTPSSAKDDL